MARELRLGLDTYSYHLAAPVWEPRPPEPLTLEGYLERAAELGVDGLALADMRHFPATDPQTVERIKASARRRSLYLELGTGGVDADHLRSTLRLARAFAGQQRRSSPAGGVDAVLRTFVSIGKTWSPPGEYPAALRRVVQSLRDLTETCEQTGVALAIENHQDLTSRELAELLEEVDHPLVGACWDTGNSLGVLEHPLDGLRNLADRTFTVHFKSYALLPHAVEGRPAGYVLVGVPPACNRQMLRESLAILARRSPAESLHVNVESAVEYIPITPGRRGWRPEHAAAAEQLLERFGLGGAAGEPSGGEAWAPWLPRKDMSLTELLEMEDRLVRESVRQARAMLDEFAGPRTD